MRLVGVLLRAGVGRAAGALVAALVSGASSAGLILLVIRVWNEGSFTDPKALVTFVREDIAIGIIGPEGVKYAPYLLAVFMFVVVVAANIVVGAEHAGVVGSTDGVGHDRSAHDGSSSSSVR